MKHPIFATCALVLSLFLTPKGGVYAQDPGWLESVAFAGYNLVEMLVPVLISIALLVFIWGIVIFIAKSGDEQAVVEGRKKMIWGVVALFVIVSVWGLVRLLQDTSGIHSRDDIVGPSVMMGDTIGGTSNTGTSVTNTDDTTNPSSGDPTDPTFVGPPLPELPGAVGS